MCVKCEIFTAGKGTGPAGSLVLGLRLGFCCTETGLTQDLVHERH